MREHSTRIRALLFVPALVVSTVPACATIAGLDPPDAPKSASTGQGGSAGRVTEDPPGPLTTPGATSTAPPSTTIPSGSATTPAPGPPACVSRLPCGGDGDCCLGRCHQDGSCGGDCKSGFGCEPFS